MIRSNGNNSCACVSGFFAAGNSLSTLMNAALRRRRRDGMGMPREATVWGAWSPGIADHAPHYWRLG